MLVILTLPQWGTTYAVCPLISKEKVGIAVVDIVNQVYGLPLPWLFLVVRTWSCSFHHSASRRHHSANGIEQHTVMERNRWLWICHGHRRGGEVSSPVNIGTMDDMLWETTRTRRIIVDNHQFRPNAKREQRQTETTTRKFQKQSKQIWQY